jgi:hypothetical protein
MAREPWACRSQCGEIAAMMPALAAAPPHHAVDGTLSELAATHASFRRVLPFVASLAIYRDAVI